jgi:hypothetical protein
LLPHFGHGGAGFVESERNSSNCSSHFVAAILVDRHGPSLAPIERCGKRGRAGRSPTDEDLEGVRDFLDRILPALAEIEERLPPETAP